MPKSRGFTTFSLHKRGFTLVELLVVIAIIAILSTIGIITYLGIQAKARNSQRKADIDAIAKALEVHKTDSSYIALTASQFATGRIPTDPISDNSYCANSTASTQPPTPVSAWTDTCPAEYGILGATNPPAGASWKVCAWLEAEGVIADQAFCRLSAQ